MAALSAFQRLSIQFTSLVDNCLRHFKGFRNRISEAALAALGIPVHTTEVETEIQPPPSPDIRVGKIVRSPLGVDFFSASDAPGEKNPRKTLSRKNSGYCV